MDRTKTVLWLKVAFLIGAVVDALAIVPMLSPAFAARMWGFSGMGGAYFYAMGYGASLMLGWTALLVWAIFKPLERRGVALLTVIVVVGFAGTEVACAAAGVIRLGAIVPMLAMQAVLTALYTFVYVMSGRFSAR